MNKLNKILFSVLVTVLCGFGVFTSSVDAYIKETIDSSATDADHIENGTTVIGITKFSPSTIITAKRASQATLNDMAFHLGDANYAGVHIYYYYYGWYEFDENNVSTPVTNASALNELNIFYVDNIEKKLTIPYASSSNNLSFKTDKANKTATYANGMITVPATVREIQVLNNGREEAKFVKANESDTVFLENPRTGKLVLNDTNLVSLPGENSLTIQSSNPIPYKFISAPDLANGNYVSIGIETEDGSRPEVENRNKIKFLVKDANNLQGKEYTWGESVNDSVRSFDILFTEDIREATIDVTWEEGNTQTFKISLTSVTPLEEAPTGRIEWDYDDIIGPSKDESLPFTPVPVSDDTIIFDEETVIGYFEGNDKLSQGNRVGFYIFANEKYSENGPKSFEVSGIVEGDTARPVWEETSDGSSKALHYVPLFTETTREITISVTWEDGFTQIFTVNAELAILETPSN